MTLTKWVSLLMVLVMSLSLTMTAGAEEALNAIMNAKTTQAFTDEAVADEDLTAILQAGLSATSAINQQPWFFAVVTNQEVMTEIGASGGFGGAPAGMPAGGVPAGMPEGGAPEGMPEGAPEGMPAMPAAPAGGSSAKAALGDSPAAIIIYKNNGTPSPDASFDCGLAVQNMVIAANALGYGTKIVSSPTMSLNGENHDALCEKLGVDPAYEAVAVLLLGKADAGVDGYAGASVRSDITEKVSFVK